LKWLLVVDLDPQLVLTHSARRGSWNDCCQWMDMPNRVTPIGLVLADGEFDSKRSHTLIYQQFGAEGVIPASRGKKIWKLDGAVMHTDFPRRVYGRRALLETVFSTIK